MLLNGKYTVQYAGNGSAEEIAIVFTGGWQIVRRNTLAFRDGVLEGSGIRWIWKRANDWYVTFDASSGSSSTFSRILDWMKGVWPFREVTIARTRSVEEPARVLSSGFIGRSSW